MTYEQFIQKIDKLIWSISYKYSIKNYDVDDIRQELLMKCYDVYELYDDKNAITTFITPLLTNHILDIIKSNNRDIRCNKDEHGNNLRDTKSFDFDRLIGDKPYTKYELLKLNEAKDYLNTYKHKDIINRILNGETQVSISNELNLSRQRINNIYIDFKSKLKVQLANANAQKEE